jgi:stress response protein YsnF
VLEEVVVVEKKLLLREEVRITRKKGSERDPQKVSVRRERVEFERVPDA